jgi:outer membrane protein
MRKISLFLFILFFSINSTFSQKIGYVDTDYILKNMGEFVAAKKQLDAISEGWQKEIDALKAEIFKMKQDYQAEKVLLSQEMRTKREADISKREKDLAKLQSKRYGSGGDLFKKQQELIKPIQDKVYNAIKEISDTKNYVIVFDKAGSTTILYTNNKFDISNDVIKFLGYEPGQVDSFDDFKDEDDDLDDY